MEKFDFIREEYTYKKGHNAQKEFLEPVLKESIAYDRSAGFYTGYSLLAYGIALHTILKKENYKIRLIVSPLLGKAEIEALEEKENRTDLYMDSINKKVDEIIEEATGINSSPSDKKNKIKKVLCWLISHKKLEIRIAIPVHVESAGDHHEKEGIIHLSEEHKVFFDGSINESFHAWVKQGDKVNTYCSWKSEQKNKVNNKVEEFEKLWGSCDSKHEEYPGVEIKSINKKMLDKIKERSQKIDVKNLLKDEYEQVNKFIKEVGFGDIISPSLEPSHPKGLILRKYQEDARANWFEENGNGTLKMATGSGKTITALSIALSLYEKIDLSVIIVLCPYQHLVDQWDKNAKMFNFNPILAYESKYKWIEAIDNFLIQYTMDPKEAGTLFLITTKNTFITELFQKKLKDFPHNSLIIGDEVHNYGATTIRNKLPNDFHYKLGLSATPERWFDEEGSASIFEFFGEVLEPEFTLKDAIKANALCPYNYYPIFVYLTEEESRDYLDISASIAKLYYIKKNDKDLNDKYNKLLIKRSRIVASAQDKLNSLKILMSDKTKLNHWIFYCGDSDVEDDTSGEETKQIDAVCKILGAQLEMAIDKFTAETPKEERAQIITDLNNKVLQGLVAIRCLDEGVDIPSVERAVILASSTNPKQFIQRRGRLLRKDKDNPNKVAQIYDMIVLPQHTTNLSKTVKNLILKELRRFTEFAKLSNNFYDAVNQIEKIKEKYELE